VLRDVFEGVNSEILARKNDYICSNTSKNGKPMLSKTVEKALNDQVEREASSSQYYLAMASWAETQGLPGVSEFFYKQSDEERQHMLKLVKYINERGGNAEVRTLKAPPTGWENVKAVFEQLLQHEIAISTSINRLVEICLEEKDFTTQNFLQWYVSEQIEEEAVARTILDKLNLIGDDKGGLYLFDRDVQNLTVESAAFTPGQGI